MVMEGPRLQERGPRSVERASDYAAAGIGLCWHPHGLETNNQLLLGLDVGKGFVWWRRGSFG